MAGKNSKKGVKALLVNHAEKGVFGLAALMGLATLGMSRWSHFDGTPDRITGKVRTSKAELEARTWPVEEQQQFVLTKEQIPAQVVYDSLRREYRADGYPFYMELSAKFNVPLYQRKEPLKDPVLVGLDQPLATAGRVLIQKAPVLLAAADEKDKDAKTDGSAEKKTEENVRDEFRKRPMGGGPGGPGGLMAGEMSPGLSAYTAPDLYTPPAVGAGPMGEMASGMAALPKVEAEGHHYVAVRAVFPVKEQIRKFAEAIQRPFSDASRAFDIIDFALERQELVSAADDQWTEWSPVDRASAEDVLTTSDGFDPEVIAGTVTNSVMTMPLPRRVFGQWYTDITHPALERFELSPKEINEQLEYNRKLLERYFEDQKSLAQPKIERKGFSGMQFDSREMQAAAFGGSAYDMSSMGGGYGGGYGGAMPETPYGASGGYSGGYGGSGGGLMVTNAQRPGAAGSGRGAQMTPEELMKKLQGTNDKKEQDKTLTEWIRTRATVDGELLLFRYIDFAVEPGKTYRYRARVELINPNFGRQPSEANGEASVVQGETRTTKWSEVTPAAYVKPDVDYFVATVDTKKTLPLARMNMFQWDSKLGTVVQGAIEAYAGQTIGGKQKTDVINPAEHTYENEDYTFASRDFLVDAAGDAKLDAKYHSELKFTNSSGDLGLPAQVLVSEADGELRQIDAIKAAGDEKEARQYLKDQAEYFDHIKQLAIAATSTLGLGGLGESSSDMSGYMDMYASGRQKSVMKKGGGNSGSGGGYSGSGSGGGYPGSGGGYPGMAPPGGGRRSGPRVNQP